MLLHQELLPGESGDLNGRSSTLRSQLPAKGQNLQFARESATREAGRDCSVAGATSVFIVKNSQTRELRFPPDAPRRPQPRPWPHGGRPAGFGRSAQGDCDGKHASRLYVGVQ